jgi:outer membrane lipoprotein carrier protein
VEKARSPDYNGDKKMKLPPALSIFWIAGALVAALAMSGAAPPNPRNPELGSPVPVQIASPDPRQVVANMERVLAALETYQADFEQSQYSTSVAKPLREKGRIYLKKPDLIKWEYSDPEKKIILYKEGLLLSYFPEDNQLWRQKLPKDRYEAEIPGLLAGRSHLAEKYIIESSPVPGGGPNAAQVKLTPREEGENDYILLEIDQRTWLIQKAVIFDWAGNKTEFAFSRIKTNPRLAADFFNLKVPPDCDIIDNETARKK